MVSRASPPPVMGQVNDVFPKLGELTGKVFFGAAVVAREVFAERNA